MVVPAGCAVGAPILPLQNETSILSDPHVFDGFRYSRMNEESPGPTKYEMVNTSLNYLFFGYGKHAWYELSDLANRLAIVANASSPQPWSIFGSGRDETHTCNHAPAIRHKAHPRNATEGHVVWDGFRSRTQAPYFNKNHGHQGRSLIA